MTVLVACLACFVIGMFVRWENKELGAFLDYTVLRILNTICRALDYIGERIIRHEDG